MTILRSREIIPKSPPDIPKCSIIKPSTPNKTHESALMSSSTLHHKQTVRLGLQFDLTPLSSSSSLSPGPRRSSRLASKSIPITEDSNEKVIVDEENEESLNISEVNERNLGSGEGSKIVNGSSSRNSVSVDEKVRVSTEAVDCDGGNKEGKEKKVFSGFRGSSGSSSLRRSKRLMNVGIGNEEREVEIDLKLLAEVRKGILNLESANGIAKSIKSEVFDIDSDESMKALNGLADEKLESGLSLSPDKSGVVDAEMMETESNPVVNGNEEVVAAMEIDLKITSTHYGSTSRGKRKYSKDEKGKGISIDSDSHPVANCHIQVDEKVAEEQKRTISKESIRMKAVRRRENRERFHNRARRSASRFAHFLHEAEENNQPQPAPASRNNEVPSPVVNHKVEDWPGPFSTAMKIIRDRAMKLNAPSINSTFGASNAEEPVIEWTPSVESRKKDLTSMVPFLQDMCLHMLVKNVEAIVSLEAVPDVLKHRLSDLLCDCRMMNSHFMELLASRSPTEIRVKDSSWLTEEQFTKIFEGCDTSKLMVLQLDLCGRCLPDYILRATLARYPNGLPALSSISLKGACRLTDAGLKALVGAAPSLSSINLGQCSLLSSTGISNLADSLGSVLRELYLDDCQNIDMMRILPALQKLESLEVLSLADNQTVCDDFVSQFVSLCGPKLKELVCTDCRKLTDTSVKAIAENCPELRGLDLANLNKLTDLALGYLANGCRSIQTLKLRSNHFSDEAVAAFLEASGEPLTVFSLNNVKKIGNNTAISLARRCSRNLVSLDLSWCRNLTDAALGLIVDSCSSLKILKLFGCTQVTPLFVDGHSNPLVQVVGLKLTPILENLNMLGLQESPLRYSSVHLNSEI